MVFYLVLLFAKPTFQTSHDNSAGDVQPAIGSVPAEKVKTIVSPGFTDKGRPNPESIGETGQPIWWEDQSITSTVLVN